MSRSCSNPRWLCYSQRMGLGTRVSYLTSPEAQFSHPNVFEGLPFTETDTQFSFHVFSARFVNLMNFSISEYLKNV